MSDPIRSISQNNYLLAAQQEVSHDNTLSGNGTEASPLGLNETVLWTGDYTNSGSIALSESYKNFSVMAVYFKDNNNNTDIRYIDTANQGGRMILLSYSFGTLSSQVQLWIKPTNYTLTNTSITYVEDNEFNLYEGSVRLNGAGQRIHILKVVGINRIANN